jgi:general secretion pathway protein G
MDKRKNRSAFTLIEVIIALAIVMGLSSVVTVGLLQQQRKAKVDQARLQIKNLEAAVQIYFSEQGRVPSSAQGLRALERKPEVAPIPRNYPPEGYLGGKSVPPDPWQNDYIYISPGRAGQLFEIISYGSDGEPGGEGYAADISNKDL